MKILKYFISKFKLLDSQNLEEEYKSSPGSDIEFEDFDAKPHSPFRDDFINPMPQNNVPSNCIAQPTQPLPNPEASKSNRNIKKKFLISRKSSLNSPITSFKSSFGIKSDSKPTTDNSIEKIFKIQSIPNLGSLINPNSEEMKQGENSYKSNFSLPSSGLDDRNLNKKKKQERNRESAKKCREKKKEYLYQLESELKDVKEELERCKCELELLKNQINSNLENQYNNHRNELLSQAAAILSSGMIIPKLTEILSKLLVLLIYI